MKQISMDLGGAVHSLARARYTKRQRDALTLERCLREVMHPCRRFKAGIQLRRPVSQSRRQQMDVRDDLPHRMPQ